MKNQVAIVIGSEKDKLEKFIEGINNKFKNDHDDFFSNKMKNFFKKFKLIDVENNFWVLAFYDRQCEWDDEKDNMFYFMKDEIEKEKLSYTYTRFNNESDYEETSNFFGNASFDIRLLKIATINIVATLNFCLESEFKI